MANLFDICVVLKVLSSEYQCSISTVTAGKDKQMEEKVKEAWEKGVALMIEGYS